MRIVLLVIVLLFTICNYSQTNQIKIITSNDGLPSNNIRKVFVDSKSNLWVGSRSGLAVQRMNGFEMATASIKYKFNNIFDIAEDASQNIWVAGYGQGVLYFNNKKSYLFNESNGLVSNYSRVIKIVDDKIFVGTLNGISIIDKNNFSIVNPSFVKNEDYDFSVSSFFQINGKIYATTINDGIYEVTNKKVIKISDVKKIYSSFVFNNKLFIATSKNILELDSKSFTVIKTIPIGNVWDFLVYKGELYVLSSGIFENSYGIYKITENGFKSISEKYQIITDDISCMIYDKKRDLVFIGTQDNGLIQVDLNTPIKHYPNYNIVYCIAINENNRYIFHDKGLSIESNDQIISNTSNKKFKNVQEREYKRYKDVAVITNHFYPIDYFTPADNIIFYDAISHQKKIYLATNIGFYILNHKGDILNYLPIHIYNFTFFKNLLLAPVPYGGIRVFSDITNMKYDYFHDYGNENVPANIVSIAKNKDQVFLASALNGLYRYKDGKFESFLANKLFNEPKLKRITLTDNNTLLVVTDYNDIYELSINKNPGKIIKHIPYQKVIGTATRSIETNEGAIFVTTNLGINVFKGDKFFFIDKDQGLLNYNVTKTFLDGNNLLIGTKKGYYSIDTGFINKIRREENNVIISNLIINNKDKTDLLSQFKKNIILSNDENNIVLKYYISNTKYPNKLNFQYRLKKTEDWQNTDGNEIKLNYLNHGSYNVQLKIENYSTGTIVIHNIVGIKINPPYYLTWTFFISAFVICSLLVIIFFKYRISSLNRKEQRRQELNFLKNEKEKQELLFDRKLADVKLQVLRSQMNSHFLFNVMNSIQYYILCNDTKNALYYLERFSALIRTTLNYSDLKEISLCQEIDYLKKYVEIENLRTENKILFKLDIAANLNPSEIKVAPLILQPFVENAIVHAFPNRIKSPEILLKVFFKENQLIIVFKDNGIGYKNNKLKTHESKGVSIVQSRLDLTQKKLDNRIVTTSNDSGTEVVIILDDY